MVGFTLCKPIGRRHDCFLVLFGLIAGFLLTPILQNLDLFIFDSVAKNHEKNGGQIALVNAGNINSKNDSKTRVGVLIMATGKYARFTIRLVNSARRNLLNDRSKNYQVTYFIFTDNPQEIANGDDVVAIEQRRLGWPSDTLWRCAVYLNSSSILTERTDYLFSLDADMLFLSPVGAEILGDLVGTLHPGFYNKSRFEFDYERHPASCAQISFRAGGQYFAGGVYGGRTREVLRLCNETTNCIKSDLAQTNGTLVAKWHDESHLNHYFALVKPPTVILSPAYCYAQGMDLPYEAKIVALAKQHNLLRNA